MLRMARSVLSNAFATTKNGVFAIVAAVALAGGGLRQWHAPRSRPEAGAMHRGRHG